MRSFVAATVVMVVTVGCTTPPEIKQALIAKDQAYVENERLMAQYRELVANIGDRHRTWYQFVKTRLLLDLAVQWATTNPQQPGVPDPVLAEDDAELLGPDVVALINATRLQSLPERNNSKGESVFTPGTRPMNDLLAQLPDLVARVGKKVRESASELQPTDMAVFESYRTNVEALRRINAMIKHYLDIDVTLTPAQVQSIAEAATQLHR